MASAGSKTARAQSAPGSAANVARRNSAWAFTIAGWSGFYVMMVELLSSRLIAPFFGNNIYIWGSIIFVFMLGLAIGYLLGGIYSRHDPKVTKLCMILWASAAATLPTVLVGDAFMNWIFDAIVDPRFGSLTACIFLYFLPTIFAGMISPYAIRIIVQNRESSGYDAGYLYFVSTVGSSAGTLLTSFYFVLWFEVNTILLLGMAVSAVLGGAGIIANRKEADRA
jgi:hypothetical protein